jgi:hypothetical protein
VGEHNLAPPPWNLFYPPESRLLNRDLLPAHEHDLFILDGEYTVKIFKGYGATSFRLFTSVNLTPGSYLFQINAFPDLVNHYEDGEKIPPSDPYSGEVRFMVDGPVGGPDGPWTAPTFGQMNNIHHIFEVSSEGAVDLGVAFRTRYAIQNNGWFLDDWSLAEIVD